MKKRMKELGEKERIATLDALYTAAGSLRGRDAMKDFLRDLLTESERVMLGRRIMIARLLLSGATRREIATRLQVGLDTIQRIERWLSDQMPGYENAIAGLERAHGKREQKFEADKRFAALKRKYPLHFLLFKDPFTNRRIPR